MRWDHLFDDLEAQVTRAEREEFEEEVRARAQGESAAVTLGAVLAASDGATVRLTLRDGGAVSGTVMDCAAQWLHIADGPREFLVPVTAISALDGAPPAAPEPGVIASRLTLGRHRAGPVEPSVGFDEPVMGVGRVTGTGELQG